jgi:hypothetical protein
MLLGEMKIGKPLEIFINRDGYNYRVVSKIEDATPGRVCITLIASAKRVFQFLESDVVDIVYRNDDRMWKWTNVKGSLIELEGETFHCIISRDNGEPYNRRNAYRVNIDERISLQHKLMDKDKKDAVSQETKNSLAGRFGLDISSGLEACYSIETFEVLLRDISEVGVGFYSNELLLLEDEVAFEFNSKVGVIKCEAIIVRFFESRHGSYRYYYGCRFTETSRTLTKYIYEMQRQELQRVKDKLVR